MAEKTFFEIFAEEAPDISKTFGGLYHCVKDTCGLDEKTWELVYIALKASSCSAHAVAVHAGFAKNAGATPDEVRGAIFLFLTSFFRPAC